MNGYSAKRKCGCGEKVILGTTENGRTIVLDVVRPVYSVVALEYPARSDKEIVRIQRAPTLEHDPPETFIRERGIPSGPFLMASYTIHRCKYAAA